MELDLTTIGGGLVGLGLLAKGLLNRAASSMTCANCPVTVEVLRMIREMYEAHCGIRAVDRDGNLRWYMPDRVESKLDKIIDICREHHDG